MAVGGKYGRLSRGKRGKGEESVNKGQIWRMKGGLTRGHTHSKSMDQPDKVADPARGQLNMED